MAHSNHEDSREKQEGMEYTEAIRNTLDEKAGRQFELIKLERGYQAGIFYASGGCYEGTRRNTAKEVIAAIFNAGRPAWCGETITFHNRKALERMIVLVEGYGSVVFKLRNGKVEILLGNSVKPVTGDYIQEVLRRAMARLPEDITSVASI